MKSFNLILLILFILSIAQSTYGKAIVIDENNWEDLLSRDEWMVEL